MNPIEMNFPEIFMTGSVPQDANKLSLFADCHAAWGCCMCGNTPPEHFGTVLVEIGERLGIKTDPDSLKEVSKKWDAAGKPLDFFDNEIYKTTKGSKSRFELLQDEIAALKVAIKDVVHAEIRHTRHGDPYKGLQHCIVILNKVAFDSVWV